VILISAEAIEIFLLLQHVILGALPFGSMLETFQDKVGLARLVVKACRIVLLSLSVA
jgi:hypothetical protein